MLAKLKVVAVLIVILSTQIILYAQNKADKIDNLLNHYYDKGHFNGVVLVAENGNVIYKKGYGKANIEWNIPFSVDTKVPVYSISKQFTAMCVMLLVEEGKLSLEGKLSDYLPYYRKDTRDKITIQTRGGTVLDFLTLTKSWELPTPVLR